MKLTRAELIAKAIEHAKTMGSFKLTGQRHVRESIIVYCAVVGTNNNHACIEVTLDADTGDTIQATLIPDVSVLHAYLPERKPEKPNPN